MGGDGEVTDVRTLRSYGPGSLSYGRRDSGVTGRALKLRTEILKNREALKLQTRTDEILLNM